MIMLMEINIITAALLAILGLAMGSFAGATVWRLRVRQLAEDKSRGDRSSTKDYKKLSYLLKPISKDRSHCLECQHELKWYDLLPLVSWLSLGGKCRYCQKPIGRTEPLVELGVAAFFVLSYVLWPVALQAPIDIAQFVIWLTAGVLLTILFIYDLKWFLLPDSITFSVVGLGAILSLLRLTQSGDITASLWSLVGSVVILSGLYFVIYIGSKGKMIGFGDIKLGLGLALLLGDWALAFLALFLANFIGCLIVLPAMLRGKLSRKSHIPFGPLLIAGFAITGLVGHQLIAQYMNLLF
ncbi:MAG: prepilin peptidase [bacterium]|nr:prepilin peptidase [bacterium]